MTEKKNRLSPEERELRQLQALLMTDDANIQVGALPGKTEVGKFALAVTTKMLLMVLNEQWTIPNAEIAMKVAKIGFDVHRISEGLPTTITSGADKDAVKKAIADAKARKEADDR